MPSMRMSVVWAAPLGSLLALNGRSADVAPTQTVLVDEMTAHGGQVCLRQLPTSVDDPAGHGFGTDEPATEKPSLLTPESAWVCRYLPVDAGSTLDGGARFVWQREGEPTPLTQAQLTAMVPLLTELAPQGDQACPADLGPRLVMVFSHSRDLTGVVVDDYGCGSVRLTNEPFLRAPGDPGQEGTVPGRLSMPSQFLAELRRE